MVKIAICYWGMTRTTKLIYESHYTYLYNILKKNNIEYNIFMHTWKTNHNKILIWGEYSTEDIDYNEYKLLNPDYYLIENQEDFLEKINFSDYFNEDLYNKYGDSPYEWRPYLVRNHLCALESQKRVYNMVINTNINYDYIMYIRPDVMIYNEFDINWIKNDFDFITLNYRHYAGLCDIFAILPLYAAEWYSVRINEIANYRKNNGRIVSEEYCKFIVNKYYNNIGYINFEMKIIRPDGTAV